MTEASPSALAGKLESLRVLPQLDSGLLGRIEQWILSAPETDLFRINLVELSARWESRLRTLITHFLHLTRAGVMDLSWDIHCPFCNVVLDRAGSLQEVCGVHRCQYCQRDVTSRLDDHFEVTFTVNESIRPVRGRVRYEPSANVEIILKAGVPSGATVRENLHLPGHVHNLRFVTWPPLDVQVVPVGAGPAAGELLLSADGGAVPPVAIPHGGYDLSLVNESEVAKNLMIEDHDMREYLPGEVAARLRGTDVVSTPAFRELFANETLSERESLSIREVTVAFTDISGSTSLYESLGDVRAYNLVRDHFELLFESVRRHDGQIVKTIGDAVMAGFPSPAAAVRSLLEVQETLMAFNRRPDAPGEIVLRAGVHTGPAILVTLNRALDYFGTMVNEASRIEHACPPRAIALSENVYSAEGVSAAIGGLRVDSIRTDLRGLEKTYRLYILTRHQ